MRASRCLLVLIVLLVILIVVVSLRPVNGSNNTGPLGELSSRVATNPGVLRQLARLVNILDTFDVNEVEMAARRVDEASQQQLGADGGAASLDARYHRVNRLSHQHVVSNNSIFVSLASFRDNECKDTIRDLYARAKRPTDLFVGVVQQHKNEDSCIHHAQSCDPLKFCFSDNVRIRHIPPAKSGGPTMGRYLSVLLYRGEKYYFMLDSHSRFVPEWDFLIINMYETLRGRGVKKPVFSHYPEAYSESDRDTVGLSGRMSTGYLCGASFHDYGYPRLNGMIVSSAKEPMLQPFTAAGFLFADATVLREVPFDPYLDMVFDGEEILYSARLWTHGWDMFAPSRNIAFHHYGRPNAPKVWSEASDWHPRQVKSVKRIQYFLGATKKGTEERIVDADTNEEHVVREEDMYGLGSQRSLEAYYLFAGINMTARTVSDRFCQWGRSGVKSAELLAAIKPWGFA